MSRGMVVGLTGGIASGKTTVANYLESLGAFLVDTDVIARQVVAPETPTTRAIAELLGQDYLLADGQLNRAKIKACIFNDKTCLRQYEAIILPAIREATLTALQNAPVTAEYILLIVPLLFEKGLDAHCDYVITVDIPVEEQVRRAILRQSSDESVIRQIIATQLPRQVRNQRADFIIDNTQTLDDLHLQLMTLHQRLLKLKQEKPLH